jgi:MFS family permease
MGAFLSMSFARNSTEYYASGILIAMAGVGPPTLQSALTKHVAKEEVGRLLGALSLLGSLSRVVSPLILNSLYSLTVASCPQTIFYVLAGLMAIGFFLSCCIKPHGMFPKL